MRVDNLYSNMYPVMFVCDSFSDGAYKGEEPQVDGNDGRHVDVEICELSTRKKVHRQFKKMNVCMLSCILV